MEPRSIARLCIQMHPFAKKKKKSYTKIQIKHLPCFVKKNRFLGFRLKPEISLLRQLPSITYEDAALVLPPQNFLTNLLFSQPLYNSAIDRSKTKQNKTKNDRSIDNRKTHLKSGGNRELLLQKRIRFPSGKKGVRVSPVSVSISIHASPIIGGRASYYSWFPMKDSNPLGFPDGFQIERILDCVDLQSQRLHFFPLRISDRNLQISPSLFTPFILNKFGHADGIMVILTDKS